MSNPFEAHGITHLSPSSIHAFAMSPALWVMERLLKQFSPPSAAMHRGTASEHGIVAGLMEPTKDIDECVELATSKYRSLVALSSDPNVDTEAALIPGIVKLGIQELRPYGIPSHTQGRIEHNFEGLSVPVVGIYDIRWEQHGRLLDIKTTGKMPSQIKLSHAEQVSFYTCAISENISAEVAYFTNKKAAVYQLENVRAHSNALHKRAMAIQKFISNSTDPYELAGMVTPDYDHYCWNNPKARRKGFDLFGF